MIRHFALLLLCTGLLAACGSVPQPFRGTPKITTDNALFDVPSATGVEVLPIAGLPPDQSLRLARAVADQLLELEIPAEARPYRGRLGYSLEGRAGASVTSPGGEQFDVAWMVKSRRGAIVGQFTQAVRIPPEPGTPILEARQTSEQVAVAMGLTDSPGVAPTQGSYKAKSTLPTISVKPVEGASGDGRDSLRLAVLQALTDGGLKRDDIDPDVNVTCFIDAKAHDIASQEVRITWHAVLRDGQELGVLHLENIVPNGTLDGSWGPTAFAIAAAAQPDLVKLINTQIKR